MHSSPPRHCNTNCSITAIPFENTSGGKKCSRLYSEKKIADRKITGFAFYKQRALGREHTFWNLILFSNLFALLEDIPLCINPNG
jgi:hypothetical protein